MTETRDDEDMTTAWKFLDERSRGIFSGFRWPTPGTPDTPGAWVETGDVIACERGVHACHLEDLAWWMSAQLWEIELAGPIVTDQHKIIAARGRLVRHVDSWPGIGQALAEWAVSRVRRHVAGVLDEVGDSALAERIRDAEQLGGAVEAAAESTHDPQSAAGVATAQLIDAGGDVANPIVACHDAARAAGHAATIADHSIHIYKVAFAEERVAQSRWIVDRLRLAGS